MKHIVIALAALSVAASALAQGTVNFATRSGTAVNAPVTYAGGGNVLGTGDAAVWGQLYVSAPGGTLAAAGAPVPFRSDAGAGFITAGGTVEIPGTTVGGSGQVKLVAWYASQGATYAEAMGKGLGGFGESAVLTVNGLGGGTTPPALLAGLQGFSVSAVVPEPSIAALGLLGAGLLLIRRKK
ncbi:MAG: PEP-CTERM sorting domain-containing protein [Limisphaerales bacterium]